MRHAPFAALVAILLTLAVAPEAQARTEPDPRTETIARLLQPATVELSSARLEDVMIYLQESTGAHIDITWRDGNAAGIGLDRDAEVTLSWRDAPALSLIERVLEKTGDEFDPATWQVTDEGILDIAPRSVLNRRASAKLYDVQDLLLEIPDFTEVPDLELGSIVQGQGGSGQEVDLTTGAGTTEAERLEQLIEIIQTSIEFDQWRDNGGDAAEISAFRGALLVRAPGYIHRQLGGYDFWPTDAQIRRYARR